MNRVQTASCVLTASAFVLAGLLIAQLDALTPRAEAEVAVSENNLSLLTARTATDEEALFILDGQRQRLLIYQVRLGRAGGRGTGRLERVHTVNLGEMAGGGGSGGGGGRGR
jgi:hypothetical protein